MTHLRASFTKVPLYQNFLQIRSYIWILHDQASTQECSPGSSPQALPVHLWGRADVSKSGTVRFHHFNSVLITALNQLKDIVVLSKLLPRPGLLARAAGNAAVLQPAPALSHSAAGLA